MGRRASRELGSRSGPSVRRALLLALACTLAGCPGEPPPADAGPTERGCGSIGFSSLVFARPSTGVVVGGRRASFVELPHDCQREVVVTLEVAPSGVVAVPEQVVIAPGRSRASFVFEGLAEGAATLTASVSDPASGESAEASAELVVTADEAPPCDGSASGALTPGGEVRARSGGLAGAGIALPEGAAAEGQYHVEPFEASLACAEDLGLAGHRALGPAVTFGPSHTRLRREIPLTLPIRLALLPEGAHRGHVAVAYRGPSDVEARLVPVASPRFAGSEAGGLLTFEVPRLGTYQAVVREDAPRVRERRYTFRSVLGFSMGGSGAGNIGFADPERFDFVAALGGPTDWTFMLEHIRRNHLGGFCDAEERERAPAECALGSSLERVPTATQLHEHPQHFERWWYEDGLEGQGGTFNRRDYVEIFRDLTAMFGNANHDRSLLESEPNVTPPGVPDARRDLPDAERCAPGAAVVIPPFDGAGDFLSGGAARGFFDDEYNPEGRHPVITFCDGGEVPGDVGAWAPGGHHGTPTEIVLAVDLDGDGLRGPGEPVIRNGREPFEDVGLDGVPSPLEVGPAGETYDAVLRPDPAGDDFDYQYNPTGTEGNWRRDGERCVAGAPGVAEPFEDVGLDGVAGTRQIAPAGGLPGDGFDSGEGNGCFDLAQGAARMIDSSPRARVEGMDDATLDDLDVFSDGGVRDLFNWVVMANVTTAGWTARGLPVRFYNGHAALHLNDAPDFDFLRVPWGEIGRVAMVRYGDPDASESELRAGDGQHVGTNTQIIDRIRAGLGVMDARWPDGDRARVLGARLCSTLDVDRCGFTNHFVFEFRSSTGRSGPVSVILPPGYFREENAERRYPVTYFLHGYGQSPEDLLALGLLLWESMNTPRVGLERRMQKMILVFPDGRCRGDECLNGTFYADAPSGNGRAPQTRTNMLELMDTIDETYRTRRPETFEVSE